MAGRPVALDARAGDEDEPLRVERRQRRLPLRVGQAADADGLCVWVGR